MSNEKAPRTISDIQSEYQSLSTRSGHIAYQIYTLKKDLELMQSTMRELNLEAASVQKAEQEAKAAAEQPVVEEVKAE